METTVNKLANENKDIYICGDFNSDLLKIDKNINYKKLYEQLCSYGTTATIMAYYHRLFTQLESLTAQLPLWITSSQIT